MTMVRRRWNPVKVSITLPKVLLDEVDGLAQEVGLSRSEVISSMVHYFVIEKERLDELFPSEV